MFGSQLQLVFKLAKENGINGSVSFIKVFKLLLEKGIKFEGVNYEYISNN